MNILKKVALVTGVLLTPAAMALAQAGSSGLQYPPQPNGLPSAGGGTASTLILYIVNLLLAVVGIIAVAFIVIGGFRYITSAGNDETAESAKKMITNAVIGLVIVILSYVIVHVIISAIAFNIT